MPGGRDRTASSLLISFLSSDSATSFILASYRSITCMSSFTFESRRWSGISPPLNGSCSSVALVGEASSPNCACVAKAKIS